MRAGGLWNRSRATCGTLGCLRRGAAAVTMAMEVARHGRALVNTLVKINMAAIKTLVVTVIAVPRGHTNGLLMAINSN